MSVTYRFQRFARSRLPGAGRVILMYHRIAEPDLDPWGLTVKPDHLAQHLTVLRRTAEPVALDTLLADRRRRRRPAVAVTFDDGYLDTLTHAADALDRQHVPATVFVSTAGVTGDPYCWWDQLAEVFLRPGRLPRRLRVSIGPASFAWDLGTDADYPATSATAYRSWRPQDPAPTARHSTYLDVWRRVIEQPEAEQRRVVAVLQEWADNPTVPDGRLLTGEDITQLGACRGITVGGHTVNHVALTAVDNETRRWEVERNRTQLQSLTGEPVDHFAYPYGRYGTDATAAVRAAGFLSAASTDPGLVPRNGDAFLLPRVQVPDLDGAAFQRWLRRISRYGAP